MFFLYSLISDFVGNITIKFLIIPFPSATNRDFNTVPVFPYDVGAEMIIFFVLKWKKEYLSGHPSMQSHYQRLFVLRN